ncbi:MAG: UV DNA damage repair endonuclease UvsE [Candidatus Omnitrophota bacterium]|nr:MAG: UV DNA damage repair endonuclease UvsE [Candidatus Omnitrophota bacterium]
MRIGYPCLNWTLGCKGSKTFRIASYSDNRLIESIENNLDCLLKMLEFNVRNNIFFFRLSSVLVPFASHPVCKYDWQRHFRKTFLNIGNFVKKNKIRISMHPDQFTLINSPDKNIFNRSHKELSYHARVLDLMGLDSTAKIQIHVGGVYGDKQKSIDRFIYRFHKLDNIIRKRLVVENDDSSYTLKNCLSISAKTRIPVLFDVFHHSLNSSGESIHDAINVALKTWKKKDGILMVDYSLQKKGARAGSHAESINIKSFKSFLEKSKPYDFDIMLEIKDKEKSALKAVKALRTDRRFVKY